MYVWALYIPQNKFVGYQKLAVNIIIIYHYVGSSDALTGVTIASQQGEETQSNSLAKTSYLFLVYVHFESLHTDPCIVCHRVVCIAECTRLTKFEPLYTE